MPQWIRRLSRRPAVPDHWYLVVRGSRICFASAERSLAEAYFHGQRAEDSVLLSAEMLLPSGGFEELVGRQVDGAA